MSDVPTSIRLVKFYTKNKIVLDTLKEYLDTLPRIEYPNPRLRSSRVIYYILPSTKTVCCVLLRIREYLNNRYFTILYTARYTYNSKYTIAHIYNITPSSRDYNVLPHYLNIDLTDVKKLESFLED